MPSHVIDFESVEESVTLSIAPENWEDSGGPAGINSYAATLDFVVSATEEMHAGVEALFETLRKMPVAVGTEQGIRAAEVPKIGPDDVSWSDLDALIELVISRVDPDAWDDAGGPCFVTADFPRLALLTLANQETHDSLWRLLTQLRRSRYASLRSDRPWEPSLAGLPLVAHLGSSAFPAAQSAEASGATGSPEPSPEEIGALKVRREPARARWKWEVVAPAGSPAQALAIHRHDGRLELAFAGRRVRIEGELAAVAYPDLTLVEYGPWGEAWRRSADARLPWLPHRTNAELARLFQVEQLAAGDQDERANLVRVRFKFRDMPADQRAYVEVAYSPEHGLPVAWEGYLEGELTLRLRFADLVDVGGEANWRTVRLEDRSGKVMAEWRLVDAEHDGEAIPSLVDGWEGYAQLDRRTTEPAVAPGFHAAIAALGRYEWAVADRRLASALVEEPGQPLLAFLRAWCHDQDRRAGTHEEAVAALEKAAAGRAAGLARFVAQGNFSFLTPAERYAVLSRQPEAERTADDWDGLARAAVAAELFEPALAHVEVALRLGGHDARQFDRARLRVELLLRLGRQEAGAGAALEWAGRADGVRPAASVEQLAQLAELLAGFGEHRVADQLLEQALGDEKLSPHERLNLFERRAASNTAMARWRLLVSAVEALPPGEPSAASPLRRRVTETLLSELTDPEQADVARQLAGETRDAVLAGHLQFRRAELVDDRMLSAQICWELFQAGQLAEEKLPWVCALLNGAGQPDRVIRILEAQLRFERRLPSALRLELAAAYEAAQRPLDARRAATHDPPARTR